MSEKAKTPAGLAFDVKNHILFAGCRNPAAMVVLSSESGKIATSLPIGTGVDGAVFNPATMEAFSSQADGTLTVIKENGPASFEIEQTVKTMTSGKTLTLDAKTNPLEPATDAHVLDTTRLSQREVLSRALVLVRAALGHQGSA